MVYLERMVKKLIGASLLISLLIAASYLRVYANSRQDYRRYLTAYQREYNHYLAIAGLYRQSPTLANQARLIKAKQTSLLARDAVLIAYFPFVRETLSPFSLTQAEGKLLQKLFQNQEHFLQQHYQQLSQATTLNQLNDLDRALSKRKVKLVTAAKLGQMLFQLNRSQIIAQEINNLQPLMLKPLTADLRNGYALALEKHYQKTNQLESNFRQQFRQFIEQMPADGWRSGKYQELTDSLNNYRKAIRQLLNISQEVIGKGQ